MSKVWAGSMTLPGKRVSRMPGTDTAAMEQSRGVCPRTQGGKLASTNRETTSFPWQVPGALAYAERQQNHFGFNLRGFSGVPQTSGCS